MSVLDELTGLEDKVRARMTELRPLLDEYVELEKAAQRLGIDAVDSKAAPSRRAGGSRRTSKTARRAPAATSDAVASEEGASTTSEATSTRTRAKAKPKKSRNSSAAKKNRQPGGSRSGQRAEQVAALVARRPGISVKELGAEVGVEPTSLYRVVKQLEGDGKLTKRGRELHPA